MSVKFTTWTKSARHPRSASRDRAVKAVDDAALGRVDPATLTVEIEPSRAEERQPSDAIKGAGYSPIAA